MGFLADDVQQGTSAVKAEESESSSSLPWFFSADAYTLHYIYTICNYLYS